MTTIGFIGTGSMGGMLIRKFIETGTFQASNIVASNRSFDKAFTLAAATGINIKTTNIEVAAASNIIFICVKPLDVKSLLNELKDVLTPDKLLISIASDITIDDITALCSARVVRIIPSITLECSKGVSLVSFCDNVTEDDKNLILSAFGRISRPVEIDEKNFELLAELTSCAPAFISSMMHEFARSAIRREGISQEVAELLVMETLAGTAELLKSFCSFDEVISRVATKGGITEEGVKVIRNVIPSMYDDILEATLSKHDLVKEKIKEQ